MKKREPARQSEYHYDDQGIQQVNEQIMNAYNSGVIDQHNAQFNPDEDPDL